MRAGPRWTRLIRQSPRPPRVSLKRSDVWAATCSDCGCYLNALEEEMFEYRCEDCEARWVDRVERWRAGGEDLELDELMESCG